MSSPDVIEDLGIVSVGPTPPLSAADGSFWLDDTSASPTSPGVLKVKSKGVWYAVVAPGGGGGVTLPVPTAEGDVLQANAALAWVAGPVNGPSY